MVHRAPINTGDAANAESWQKTFLTQSERRVDGEGVECPDGETMISRIATGLASDGHENKILFPDGEQSPCGRA